MSVRQAVLADIPVLRRYEQGVIAAEQALVACIRRDQPLTYYELESMMADPERSRILLLEAGGVPIGCGLAQIRTNEESYRELHHGYIGLLFVEEEWRGYQLIDLVIDAHVTWLKEKGMKDIRLKYYAKNVGAGRCYVRNRFEPLVIEMQLAG